MRLGGSSVDVVPAHRQHTSFGSFSISATRNWACAMGSCDVQASVMSARTSEPVGTSKKDTRRTASQRLCWRNHHRVATQPAARPEELSLHMDASQTSAWVSSDGLSHTSSASETGNKGGGGRASGGSSSMLCGLR